MNKNCILKVHLVNLIYISIYKEGGKLDYNREIYYKTPLNEVIVIERIVTVHYFEFAKDYVYKGEKHDFWEFLYVDKGEVEIMAETKGYKLEQGDIVFHKPNEFHSVWANGKIAPNIVVISFECTSAGIKYFENKILKLSDSLKNLLGEIIKEAKNAFENRLEENYSRLKKRNNSPFGSEQLLKLYIEAFLIKLAREDRISINKDRISFTTKKRMECDIVNSIIEYMKVNIGGNYSFEEICRIFLIGKTHLKIMFKSITGFGVMTYFRMLKMEEAKRMIREGKYNFTEISELLGYDSIHYFSRCFKKHENMSPSEYALSVKAKAEDGK